MLIPAFIAAAMIFTTMPAAAPEQPQPPILPDYYEEQLPGRVFADAVNLDVEVSEHGNYV